MTWNAHDWMMLLHVSLQFYGRYFRFSSLAVVSFLAKCCETANKYLLASSYTIVFPLRFLIVMSCGKPSEPSQEGDHSVCTTVHNSETIIRIAPLA